MRNFYWRQARACLIVLASLTVAGVALADEGTPLVKHLPELTNKSKGICLLPRGGELALDLAQGSDFVVVSQEPTAAQAAALGAQADKAGLIGRRLYIAQADANTPVLADNYANVVVVADATDDLLAKLDPKTVLKVLTPHGGKAVVGMARGTAGTLSQARLEEWAKSFGVPDAKVVLDNYGLWAVITKPQLPGAAEWTHRLFNSGFDPVTTDTAFTLPSMTQWLDTPYNHGAGAPRIAGGKLLSVTEGKYRSRPECEVNYLIMRDAYNGQVLWKRALNDDYAADYYLSSVVMTSDEVYLVDMPNPVILVLDPDTGKELRKIDCSALGQQVKWIALSDGILFAAGGSTDHTGGSWNGVGGAQHVKFIRDTPDALKDSIAVGDNRMLGAFDPKTGKSLWTHDEQTDSIPEYLLAVRGGRLYFMAQDKYAGALDAKTGKVLWTNPDAAKTYKESLYTQFNLSTGALETVDDTLVFARPGSSLIALNAEDGKLLWSQPKYGGHPAGALIWNQYVLSNHGTFKLRTGEAVTEWNGKKTNPYNLGGACNFLCATSQYLTGMPGAKYDLVNNIDLPRPTDFHKSPCSLGSVVAEGILFMSSFHCMCSTQLNGNIVEMSGDPRQYQKPAVEAERLTHSANPNPSTSFSPSPADWPVYRANNDRSNSSTVQVTEKGSQRWLFSLTNPYVNPPYPSDRSETSWEPAQPIAVGNLVIASGPDGAVRAFALDSGKQAWTFYTGGQITQSPAVSDGRAYVPSGDGFLYCLDVATGAELWRFRAAPAERRMMVYGHLVSTWPLFAGVLVHDGVVYTAASLLNMDATHVYALDAKSGSIIWQNNKSGLPDEKSDDGITAVGTLTVSQGKLWLRATTYDLKTGEVTLYADPKRSNLVKGGGQTGGDGGNALLNRYTGVLGGKFLLFGGRRFYESQSRPLPIGRSGQPLSIVELNPDGTGIFPHTNLANYTGAFSAWDNQQLIATPVLEDKTSINSAIKHSPILSWDVAKTISLVQSERTQPTKIFDKMGKWETVGEMPMQQWLLDTHRTYAVALTANAVVATYGMMDAPEKLSGIQGVVPTKWMVAALDRTNGHELWKQALPSEPVYDGLCIARDGSVIVQLLDGGVACFSKDTTPKRDVSTIFPADDPRLRTLSDLGVVASPAAHPLAAIDDPKRIAVIDASPANLKELAANVSLVRNYTSAGGSLVLWGLTPDGLADFNQIVGQSHLIRPFGTEKVFPLAKAMPDTLSQKILAYPVPIVMDSSDKTPGGGAWPASDTFTYVIDSGTDIAPFAKNSLIEQLSEKERQDPSIRRGDHSPWNLTSGFTGADGWWCAYMFDPNDKKKNTWTFTWPTPQSLASVSIEPNVSYRKPSRIKLTLDSGRESMEIPLNPEAVEQNFYLGGRKAQSLTMELTETTNATDPKAPQLTGINNIKVEAVRPPDYQQRVHPVLSVGGLVIYPMDRGQVVLLQLNMQAQETNLANAAKKAAIVRSLLDGLGAIKPFSTASR